MNRLFAAFIALQLGGGLLGVVAWALLSQASTEDVAAGAKALAVGMVIYLPLTLGLGALLPNYFRADQPKESLAKAHSSINLIVAAAALALVGGLIGTVLGFRTVGVALSFAGLVSVSAALQQVARITSSIRSMALASTYNVVLPGSLLVVGVVGLGENWRTLTVWAILASVFGFLTGMLLKSVRQISSTRGSSRSRRDALSAAAPLIPHMLAFAVLTQGLRIPTAGHNDATSVIEAHVIMLFVGLALAVITGVNSYLTVAAQKANESDASKIIDSNAWVYAGLGALGAVGISVAYASPMHNIFAGAKTLSLFQLAVLSAIPPAFCSYFFATSVLLRYRHTRALFLITMPIAIIYVSSGLVLAHLGADFTIHLIVYVTALMIMASLTLSVAAWHTREQLGNWRGRVPVLLGGLIPTATALAIAAF